MNRRLGRDFDTLDDVRGFAADCGITAAEEGPSALVCVHGEIVAHAEGATAQRHQVPTPADRVLGPRGRRLEDACVPSSPSS